MKIGPSIKLPIAHCVSCGHACNGTFGASAADIEIPGPSPGDFTMCINCGTLMCFTESMGLRWPTSAEIDAIAGDKTLVQASRALHELHKDIAENPVKYGVSEPKKPA